MLANGRNTGRASIDEQKPRFFSALAVILTADSRRRRGAAASWIAGHVPRLVWSGLFCSLLVSARPASDNAAGCSTGATGPLPIRVLWGLGSDEPCDHRAHTSARLVFPRRSSRFPMLLWNSLFRVQSRRRFRRVNEPAARLHGDNAIDRPRRRR